MNNPTPSTADALPPNINPWDHPELTMRWTAPEIKWIQAYATNFAREALREAGLRESRLNNLYHAALADIEALRAQAASAPNLADKAVQKRLAEQWGNEMPPLDRGKLDQAAQPQRVALSMQQIEEMARQEQFLLVCDDIESLAEIVKAVELAHGITPGDGGA